MGIASVTSNVFSAHSVLDLFFRFRQEVGDEWYESAEGASPLVIVDMVEQGTFE